MTYLRIDTSKKQAALFLKYLKTLSFITIYKEANLATKKTMSEAKKGQTKKHKNAKALIAYLNK
jgi:hypothetical protein